MTPQRCARSHGRFWTFFRMALPADDWSYDAFWGDWQGCAFCRRCNETR